jgi:hypothetical protein
MVDFEHAGAVTVMLKLMTAPHWQRIVHEARRLARRDAFPAHSYFAAIKSACAR